MRTRALAGSWCLLVALSFVMRFDEDVEAQEAAAPTVLQLDLGDVELDVTVNGDRVETCAGREGDIPLCETMLIPAAPTVMLREGFDDAALSARGWYDGTALRLAPGRNGQAIEYRFRPRSRLPEGPTTGIRHGFDSTDQVYVAYWVKYSTSWEGSNRPSHPHEIYLLTSLDGRWVNPARTHLTVYVEQNEGVPLVAMQDSLNIGTDLTGATELRAVAGCNGGPGGCYGSGTARANELFMRGSRAVLVPGRWHRVEALVRLNSIVDGVGQADGVVRVWWDGVVEVERTDVLFRTGRSPTMAFNQILIGPYIGDPGSPVDQSMWVDDLVLATGRVPS